MGYWKDREELGFVQVDEVVVVLVSEADVFAHPSRKSTSYALILRQRNLLHSVLVSECRFEYRKTYPAEEEFVFEGKHRNRCPFHDRELDRL